jgi:hypothetical protein
VLATHPALRTSLRLLPLRCTLRSHRGWPARATGKWEHTLGFVHIRPGILAANDVVYLLHRQSLALKVPVLDDVLVGTCEAFEAVLAFVWCIVGIARGDFGDAQHVAAVGADCGVVSSGPIRRAGFGGRTQEHGGRRWRSCDVCQKWTLVVADEQKVMAGCLSRGRASAGTRIALASAGQRGWRAVV